jgi:hypothetical protein
MRDNEQTSVNLVRGIDEIWYDIHEALHASNTPKSSLETLRTLVLERSTIYVPYVDSKPTVVVPSTTDNFSFGIINAPEPSPSYRSASVGTDIGNETDDTEWTTSGDLPRASGPSKRTKTISAKAGLNTRLEALEEESSDEGLDDDANMEINLGREEREEQRVEYAIAHAQEKGSHAIEEINDADEDVFSSSIWHTGVVADLEEDMEPSGTAAMTGDITVSVAPSPSISNADEGLFEPHILSKNRNLEEFDWKDVRAKLPEDWMWDIDYTATHSVNGKDHACWTCTPTEPDDPKNFPLTISDFPVVLPVEYQWPPMAGVNPPPDPRPSALIDCTAELSLEAIRDLFLTFDGSIGFYLLINGLLQIIVTEDFDTEWASSHLPHKYGGLKVCYIHQTMEPTMFQVPTKTETMKSKASHASQSSSIASIFRSSSSRTTNSLIQSLQLNDFIEARVKSSSKKEKFAGRIGLKVEKCGDPYLLMSTHVITEAILAKSHMGGMFSRKDRLEKLDDDWNEHVEIWAGNEKVC